MPPDPEPDPEVPEWFKREQERQAVAAKLGTIEKGVGDVNDKLNKILIAVIGLAGQATALRLVQTTAYDVFVASIGGYLGFFSPLVLAYRWKQLPVMLKLLLGLSTGTGLSILATSALGGQPLPIPFTTIFLALLLFILPAFAWQIDRFTKAKA